MSPPVFHPTDAIRLRVPVLLVTLEKKYSIGGWLEDVPCLARVDFEGKAAKWPAKLDALIKELVKCSSGVHSACVPQCSPKGVAEEPVVQLADKKPRESRQEWIDDLAYDVSFMFAASSATSVVGSADAETVPLCLARPRQCPHRCLVKAFCHHRVSSATWSRCCRPWKSQLQGRHVTVRLYRRVNTRRCEVAHLTSLSFMV